MVQTIEDYLHDTYKIPITPEISRAFSKKGLRHDDLADKDCEFICDCIAHAKRRPDVFLSSVFEANFSMKTPKTEQAAQYAAIAGKAAEQIVKDVEAVWNSRGWKLDTRTAIDIVTTCYEYGVILCDKPWYVVAACQTNPRIKTILANTAHISHGSTESERTDWYYDAIKPEIESLIHPKRFGADIQESSVIDIRNNILQLVINVLGLHNLK